MAGPEVPDPDMLEPSPSGRPTHLAELAVGQHARVVGYRDPDGYCERLMRLGLIPGTLIRLERRAPLNDPVEIRFRGYALVLRPAEADCLILEKA